MSCCQKMVLVLLLVWPGYSQDPCRDLELTLQAFMQKHSPHGSGEKATIKTVETELGRPDRIENSTVGMKTFFVRDGCTGEVWLDMNGIVWNTRIEKTTSLPGPSSFAALAQLDATQKRIAELTTQLQGLQAMREHLLEQGRSAAPALALPPMVGTNLAPTDADKLFEAGQFQESAAAYTAILTAAPTNTRARLRRAYCYQKTGRLKDAIEDYSAVTKAEPSALIAFQNRALAYLGVGDGDKALADYTESKRLASAPAPLSGSGSTGQGSFGGSTRSVGGTVDVRGYTRKDGTYVRPHTRSAPRR